MAVRKKKARRKKSDPKPTNGAPVAVATGPSPIDSVRDKIRARYEKPVVIFEDDADSTPIYPTRFPLLNEHFGQGIRAGSIIEIFGFEDTSKSSTAIAFAADIQKQAPRHQRHVVLVNYEGPQPWKWWRTLGLDVSKDCFTQLRPRNLEEGMADAVDLVETGAVCCLIVDSVYAAKAKARRGMLSSWNNPSARTQGVGLGVEAVKWGEAWTSIASVLQDHETVAIAVNQQREIINTGGPPQKGWKKPTTTPRGHALKFYSWIRLEMKGYALTNHDGTLRKDVDGRRIKMTVIKNKADDGTRGRVEYDLIRGIGFDLVSDLVDLAIRVGAITAKGGGNFEIGDKKVKGRDNLLALVNQDDDLQVELQAAVKEGLKVG